jgi:hypothetical protein
MGFSLEAFYQSRTGTVAPQLINPISTNTTTVSGANLLVPSFPSGIAEVIAVSAAMSNATETLTRVQLQSPNLKQIGTYPECKPFHVIAAGSTFVPQTPVLPVTDFFSSPKRLKPGESLNVAMGATGTTAECLYSAVVAIGDGGYINPYSEAAQAAVPIQPSPNSYDIITVEAITTTAAAANAWTSQPLALDQPLPKGKYALIGARVELPTGKGVRFANLLGVPSTMRPGCFPVLNANSIEPLNGLFREGNIGVWGYFTQDNIPIPEVFCTAADAAASSIYTLDCIQIE